MELIRAKILGFCMGVQRAVDLALKETERLKGQGVFTLGPLIHNPKVLDDLKKRGVKIMDAQKQNPWEIVESPDPALNQSPLPASMTEESDPPEPTVIICAHGVSPDTENDIRKGYRIVDATCPKVKASQQKAQDLAAKGYCLFLAGEANHAEIEGVMGYAQAAPFCAVVSGTDEAKKAAYGLLKKDKDAKTAILAQTTIGEEEFQKTADAVKEFFPNLEIVNTICASTKERQKALRDLLTEVDAVIIAGGKNSANTRRLFSIAEESGKPSVIIEDIREIPTPFRYFKKVGLSAGASTPDSFISEIELEFMR